MIKLFKIRSHAIGKIMAGKIGLTENQEATLAKLLDRKKTNLPKPLTVNMEKELEEFLRKQENPELPDGAKTYCKTWLKEQIYGKRYAFTSKFTDKGNVVEPESFEIIARHLKLTGIIKNDEFFDNDFIEGTPDILHPEILIDAKSSWDCFSFPLFEDEVPVEDNYWQGQGYMDLTGRLECKFIYVLCDTPDKIINGEARKYCFNNGFDLTPEIVEEFTDRLTYPGIEEKFKIKVFDIKKNPEDIKRIYERVEMCRKYIATLPQ